LVILFCASSLAGTYKVVHNFFDKPAAYPATQLVFGPDVNLYGTAGIQNGACPGGFCGNVFQLTPTGYRVIHTFTGPNGDGENPFSPVIFDKAGNLYGTTASAGSSACLKQHSDCGTIFELSPNGKGGWKETVLYRFRGSDGAFPTGSLTFDSLGNLFGTTNSGGTASCPNNTLFGCGVAYELSPGSNAWSFTLLHSFSGSDGMNPTGLIADGAGNLVGTTKYGGTVNSSCTIGCGLIYSLSSGSNGWNEQTVYGFTGGSDGAAPNGNLALDASGNLYGVTFVGGLAACSSFGSIGCGVVFVLSPDGNRWDFRTLHEFNGTDGQFPVAVMPNPAGGLYGVTYGGNPNCAALGCGLIFQMEPQSGQYNILYEFTGEKDGGDPNPLTIDSSGDLFGTTVGGGTKNYGVVFEFIP